MEHKASLNTSFLKLSSTIQGRNPGKETTQHQRQMQPGGKWRKGNWNEQEWQKEKTPKHNLYIRNKEVTRIIDITAESTVSWTLGTSIGPEASVVLPPPACAQIHSLLIVYTIYEYSETILPSDEAAESFCRVQRAQRATGSREKCSHCFFLNIYRVDIFSLQELIFNSPSHALESCKQYKYKWSSYNIWIPAIFKIDRLQKQQQIVWKQVATHVWWGGNSSQFLTKWLTVAVCYMKFTLKYIRI